jgi:hypothetical protein
MHAFSDRVWVNKVFLFSSLVPMALINTVLARLQNTFDTGLCQSERIGKTIY